jgi:hypothetical protein
MRTTSGSIPNAGPGLVNEACRSSAGAVKRVSTWGSILPRKGAWSGATTAEHGPRQASQDVRTGCSAGGSPSESSTARDSNGFHECSCLRSVAEVSEGASSSRPRWRGREAESSGRGVARASRIPVTGMASLDRAKRVRSEARKPNKQTRRARLDRKVEHPAHRRRPGFIVPSPLTGWRSSKGPGSTGQLYSLTKDRSYGANARRSPRGSARRATEDVRRRAVGFGSLSRRTQRVTSRRERKRSTGLTSCSRARFGTMAEAAAAKNRGTGGRERQRELHAPPRSGIDTDRRCRAVGWPPLRGGFARPARKEG